MPREKEIQRATVAWLKELGAYVINIHGSAYQGAGIPDLVICYRGRFVGIEVKQPGKNPTALQAHNIDLIRKAGGFAATVRSRDDLVDVMEMIYAEVDRQ